MAGGAVGNVGPYGPENLYVCRCLTPENNYESGKISPNNKKAYIPWGGKE